MFDQSPSLQEFVDPVPICQPETDLGNMLSIFQHSNCKLLAIPQDKLGWGIVSAEELLSVVTEAWLGDRLTVTSHPRNLAYQQNLPNGSIPDLRNLIKPVVVYQGSIKLNKFLNHLQAGYLSKDSETCLIVNQQGELQGQLARDKVIKYLALQASAIPPSPIGLNHLASLLEAIALPSKIATAAGQVIYVNQLWRELITESQVATEISPILSATIDLRDLNEMTKLWINEQEEYFLSSSPQPAQGHQSAPYLAQNIELLKTELNVEHQQTANWKYLQIPLTNIYPDYSQDHPQQTKAEVSYYLMLAISHSPSDLLNVNADHHGSSSSLDPTQEILATATHELKSPLTGVIGLSSLLQEQQLGILNQRQARYLELIHHSGKKMMNVVDDLIQLATLTVDSPKDLESVNLEFLCRHLYQEVLLRVNTSKDQLDSRINLTQLKINVESGREMAIANKLLLSALLFQLMLAALSVSERTQHLEIEIKSVSSLTAIVITSQNLASSNNLSLNLMIAKYLSTRLPVEVTHICSKTSCQFTLILQPENIQTAPSAPKQAEEENLQASHNKNSTANSTSNLTILCLYPELEVIDPQISQQHHGNFDLKSWSDDYGKETGYQHRIIEADSLEQAHNLARIWQLDAIILNGDQIAQPNLYLRSLQESEHLASLPLITLDSKTTEAANQIEGLNVYPCLLPAQQCNLENLIQVIQIAIES